MNGGSQQNGGDMPSKDKAPKNWPMNNPLLPLYLERDPQWSFRISNPKERERLLKLEQKRARSSVGGKRRG